MQSYQVAPQPQYLASPQMFAPQHWTMPPTMMHQLHQAPEEVYGNAGHAPDQWIMPPTMLHRPHTLSAAQQYGNPGHAVAVAAAAAAYSAVASSVSPHDPIRPGPMTQGTTMPPAMLHQMGAAELYDDVDPCS